MPVIPPTKRPARGLLCGGFTLVEILVVLVIVAALSAISLPVLQGVRSRGAIARCRSELSRAAQGLENYRLLYGDYPQSGDCPQADAFTASPLAPYHAQVRFFNALVGVFGPTARTSDENINGPSLLSLQGFSLEFPPSAEFQRSVGNPPCKRPELTCLLDPWGRRYFYFYKSVSDPAAWSLPGYVLMSAGPDGNATLPDPVTGRFASEDRNNPINADNLSVSALLQ